MRTADSENLRSWVEYVNTLSRIHIQFNHIISPCLVAVTLKDTFMLCSSAYFYALFLCNWNYIDFDTTLCLLFPRRAFKKQGLYHSQGNLSWAVDGT
ncbi:Hypothetical predicted protein [Cloeon dipterum]|uniref:Uncharacterized protein n=1 Tax=Cloeon dipterum TaxID=197152 RepID=A0A8S1CNW5_9INSE|nr:Hypothetical predicted protein [Cloeon dipterum]